MAANTQTKTPKGGKNLTTSPTRKARYTEYRNHNTRVKHKLTRILKSSGLAAAQKYAGSRMMLGVLAKILENPT